MGLPELTFSLEKAAGTVSARMSAGAVALILRDAKDNGVYTIHRESDIPAQLGAANVTAIKRAMIGYINRPSVVYVAVIATAAEISAGFAALAAYSYDYLAGPVDMPASDATTLSGLVKAQRKKRYIGKAVLPATAGDDEGTINFVAAGIKSGATTITAAQYLSLIHI